MSPGLQKPSRLDRDVSKYERRLSREKAKTAETRKAQKAWSELSAQVCKRDRNTCRICGCQTTKFGVGDPRLFGQAHHVRFRSAGGRDELSNLIWVDGKYHDAIHRYQIEVSGTADNLTVRKLVTAVAALETCW